LEGKTLGTVEKFLVLLFGAIIVGVVITNPQGLSTMFSGLSNFTSSTVKAFQGFSGGGSGYSSNLTMLG